jgi:hypothetical protein
MYPVDGNMTQSLYGLRGQEILPLPGTEPQLFCHHTEPTVLAVCFEGRYKIRVIPRVDQRPQLLLQESDARK